MPTRCPACNEITPPDAQFCPHCGTGLAVPCAGCGTPNPPAHKFCSRCGRPRGDVQAPAPRTYTPRHLAEKILTSRRALEGERKWITVLFADIKGSLELLEGRDPEEARALLDPAVQAMMEGVHRFEGTIDKVLGDGIMALFGAPVAHEDHAVRACYAALAIQTSIRRYTEEVRRTQGLELQVRVGLNSGEVVVRAIGNDLHMDYSAIGQTVHLASRMEQLSIPGTIRMTSDTAHLAEGFVETRSLGLVPVKGLTAPVEVLELTGTGPMRTRLQAAAARGLTRLVGRQEELASVEQALPRVAAGRGQVVALVGDAGVGKSRLVWEITHSRIPRDWLLLESTSVSYSKATAYLPIVALLRAYFQIDTQDNARAITEKVTARVLALDRALAAILPPFLALFDVAVEDAEWQAFDPPQRRRRTLEAIKALVLREARVQPILIVFEDLHWIDPETQAILDSLVASLPAARVFLLVNYRPEYRHGWASRGYYTQVRIDPLLPATVDELLDELLGSDAGLEPLKQLLIDRTQGNPFFLEESVRTLVETGTLVGTRGAYVAAKSPAAVQVPDSVQAVLAARIDRLSAEDKRLLQCAAVIGKHVPYALLTAIADVPEETLRDQLGSLEAAEFLYGASLFPDLEYTFKHALTHEVTYASLLQERRRTLHARIASTIEQLHPERLAEQVEPLAHHTFRGEVWDKAVTYLREAGARAAGRCAYRDAVVHCERALEALAHLPEDRGHLEAAIDLRFELRNALLPLGERARIPDYLRDAEILAGILDDQSRLGRVYAYMAQYRALLGDQDEAIKSGQRSLAIAADLGDLDLQVLATFYLGQTYHSLGQYRRAAELLRRNVKTLSGDLAHARFGLPGPLSAFSRTWLGLCLAELGEFGDGIAVIEESLRIAETVNLPYSLIQALYGTGLLYLRKGEPQNAAPALQRGHELSRVWHIPIWDPLFVSALGYAHVLSGRAAEGLPLLTQAIEGASAMKMLSGQSALVARLGEGYLMAGRVPEALSLAARALDLARTHHERALEAEAQRLLGDAVLQSAAGDGPRAEAHYRTALAPAQELGMEPLAAQCHLGLGRLYRREGDRAAAGEHLATATRLFETMRMTLPWQVASRELEESRAASAEPAPVSG